MRSGLVLQKRPASAPSYHTVKSHPVPGGHVTFKNSTDNDSTVHDVSRNEKGEIPYTLFIHFFGYQLFSRAAP